MKAGYTHVSMLLDRSGSMATTKNDTIGGINSFIEEQRKVPGVMTLTLCQFDTEYDVVHNALDIQKIPLLTDQSFIPRGSTALLDALAKCIIDTGKKLAEIPEDDRPERVMMVIVTDGEENSSREQTKKSVADMVKHQEDAYKWHFVYIGANQDAFSEAGKMGMSAGLNYHASTVGTRSAYAALGKNVAANRTSAPGTYSAMTQDDIDQEEKASK